MQQRWLPTALLLLALAAAMGQEKSATQNSSTKERRTKPQSVNLYADSWDPGETKSCSTYSGAPTLLICADMKFIHLVGDNVAAGMSEDEAYHAAFSTATSQSKEFSSQFSTSDDSDPEPWPPPQTGRKLTTWRCSKDKTISCSLIGRQK